MGSSTKMNLTSTEARAYLTTLRRLVSDLEDIELFVLPPFTALWVARECLAGSSIAWGAQDVHAADSGAHTGDISAPMLLDLGCSFVEIGHAERRRDHGESDEDVAGKVAAVLRHRMTPIVCVGEPVPMPTEDALDYVVRQIRSGFAGVSNADRARSVVAYEPVWAIGAGARSAGPDHIARLHEGIHAAFAQAGPETRTRVIYGGSVDAETARGTVATPGVDGLFVGRAALDAERFATIIRVVAADNCGAGASDLAIGRT